MRQTTLRITTASGMAQEVMISSPRMTIGRGNECDIRLQDPMVSRKHAVLVYAQGQWYIQDQGSRNGTLVNGERVGAAPLRDGDKLTMGDTSLLFSLGEAPRPAARAVTRLPGNAWKIALPLAAVAGIALLAGVVLLLARSRSSHAVQTGKANRTGVATFRDGGAGQPITVTVRDADGAPLPGVTVVYEHDGQWGYEAYFVRGEDDKLAAVAFFSHNSSHEIQLQPNVIHAATPDEARALAGYVGYTARHTRDLYQGTIPNGEYAATLKEAGTALLIEMNQAAWFYGVYATPGEARWEGERGTYEGQWDVYQAFSPSANCEQLILVASQAPAIQSVAVKAEASGVAHASWTATDQTSYPGRPGLKLELPDQTVLQGPTKGSDLVYHYRLLDGAGTAVTDWKETPRQAVDLQDLAPGAYTLEVYATDEVDNRSETAQKPFSIGEAGALSPAAPAEATETPAEPPTAEEPTAEPASSLPTEEPTATEPPSPEATPTAEAPSSGNALNASQLTTLDTLDSFRRESTIDAADGSGGEYRHTLALEFVRQPQASHTRDCDQEPSSATHSCYEVLRAGGFTYSRTDEDDWTKEETDTSIPGPADLLHATDTATLEENLGDLNVILALRPEAPLLSLAGDYVGAETVNGVPCRHFRYDKARLAQAWGVGAYFEGDTLSSAQADIWVSVERNIVIRVTLQMAAPGEGGNAKSLKVESNVLDVNRPLQIQVPQNIAG